MFQPVVSMRRVAWRHHAIGESDRAIPEETAVAFTYNGGSYAVMMATPQDLEDFAVGFSLTEGLIARPDDIRDLEIIEGDLGIELRMWLNDDKAAALRARRRHLAGPTGCGVCGIESLAEAVRQPPQVWPGGTVTPDDVLRALEALAPRQQLNVQTRAVHASGFWKSDAGLVAVREDVGRHNALDKLAGVLARSEKRGQNGIVVLTSRVSVEMVQKAAAIGAPVVVAVSAPTALAVRLADAAGITLVAIARDDGFEVFSHSQRISMTVPAHVA